MFDRFFLNSVFYYDAPLEATELEKSLATLWSASQSWPAASRIQTSSVRIMACATRSEMRAPGRLTTSQP